ncbi:phage tail protein [Chitinivorax sp. B]|uniref:phage tail-collar fiber domain-containing protein n=1 Tax=Chitinivorax sp. B TaxID=2502235 RepID=UPI0010F8AA3B|nr:phage tail protein [Chitinivorax sp. B]
MTPQYYAILTAVGEAKLANATALGTTLKLTHMGVGDGNGSTPQPNRSQTSLLHETRRAALNQLSVDPKNPNQLVAEQIIPEDAGGWWIREIGLYDAAGDLCAVANCPDTYKPVLASGSGRTQIIRLVLIVSSTTAVELKIDPSVVLATRQYADQVLIEHVKASDPHPQYTTPDDVNTLIAGKANKASTLAGYGIGNAIGYYGAVPSSKQEDIIYVPPYGLMGWVAGAKLYRSIQCGDMLLHSAPTPPPGTVLANGASLAKAVYGGLWSWAKDNNLVKPVNSWEAGCVYYAEVDATSFRVPDLRGEFFRAADEGRGIDPGRTVGYGQGSQNLKHDHYLVTETGGAVDDGYAPLKDIGIWGAPGMSNEIAILGNPAATQREARTFPHGKLNPGGDEARPRNVALLACIRF